MPPDMAISMRHTKLKAEEAALLAGELSKPSWQSRNEGIHERVSFEDTIWGFDLAGGSFYKTPLRVTHVKPDSRAEKAGIRAGDKLLRINDIDTSTLTIQEAHEIIIESGIHLKIAVTSPDDEEDAYYCYQDPLEDGYDSDEERRREAERAKKRQVCARVSHYWSLQWPWVSKRRVIYRESNCFMVPSKYEGKHKDKFTPQPFLRVADDIVMDSLKNIKLNQSMEEIENAARQILQNNVSTPTENSKNGTNEPAVKTNEDSKSKDHVSTNLVNEDAETHNAKLPNGDLAEIPEGDEEKVPQTPEIQENGFEEVPEENSEDISELDSSVVIDTPEDQVTSEEDKEVSKDDDVIHELLNGYEENKSDIDESKIFDSILNESNRQDVDTVDER